MTELTAAGGRAGSGRLVLLRHGQGMLGSEDYDRLSAPGQAQSALLAQRLGEELSPGWPAWAGSLRRHRQTLRALPASAEAHIEPALNEYSVDQLIRNALEQASGLDLQVPPEQAFADPASFLRTFLDWFPNVLEHWQADRLIDRENGSWAAFRQRVLLPVERWKRQLEASRDVVVVSSAGVISTLLAELLGEDLVWQRQLNVSLYNASWTELVLEPDGGWRLARVNCISHLQRHGLVTLA